MFHGIILCISRYFTIVCVRCRCGLRSLSMRFAFGVDAVCVRWAMTFVDVVHEAGSAFEPYKWHVNARKRSVEEYKKPLIEAINGFCVSRSGAGGIRTHVQTGKPYAFYMLILAFGFRDATRPRPPIAPLSSKISPVWRGTHWLFPIYLHRFVLRFGTTSLERCLVPPTLWRNKANLLYFD